MNPTPTPHNAQLAQSKCCGAPIRVHCPDEREGTNYYICTKCGQPCDAIGDRTRWRKITKEDPPQYPCWMLGLSGVWHYAAKDCELGNNPGINFTHWHTDQPTPPQESPAETATPETNKALRNIQGLFRAAAATNGFSDFARRLERERDQARSAAAGYLSDAQKTWKEGDALRAQLKSMTDQFLAVSGQLGEANKRAEWCEELLVSISEETDLRNIRGTIQHAFKEIRKNS